MGQWQLRQDWLLSPPACILTTPHFCSPAAQVSSPHQGAPRPPAPGPSLRFQAAHTRGQHVPTAPARPTWRAAVPGVCACSRALARRTACVPAVCAAPERGRVLHVLPESWTGPEDRPRGQTPDGLLHRPPTSVPRCPSQTSLSGALSSVTTNQLTADSDASRNRLFIVCSLRFRHCLLGQGQGENAGHRSWATFLS